MSPAEVQTPYLRLSGFYFFYFASLGAFLPYWGLYLQDLSFSPQAIGEVMAVMMVTKVVAPNVWGWIADHTGQRMAMIRFAMLLSVLGFSCVLVVTSYWWMIAVIGVYSFFWNAALPQFEATTMSRLGADAHRYSRIRVWGSVGFIVSVVGLAPIFENFGIHWLPAVVLGLLVCIWVNTLAVGESESLQPHAYPSPLRGVLLRMDVMALLLACFLAQASHGPYYTFFSIYLQANGYGSETIGLLWALGVVAEVIVFLIMHRWLPRFGARNLLLIALLLTTFRWLVIAAQVRNPGALVFAQLLHAASFGLLHAAAIHLIHQRFPGRLQGRGQALYASLSFGLGGAIGSLLSGYVWTALGPHWTFYMGALFAATGFIAVWLGVKYVSKPIAVDKAQTWEC